jgi:RpiR family carbohydrate utilization transcriptional regulator
MSLLAELRDNEAKRSKSARKLASQILEDPQAIVSMPIATLAALTGVSEPTVNRFCTGLGLKGFPDFKLTLAAELARSQPAIARDIEAGDSASQVISKLFEATRHNLTTVEEALDSSGVEETVTTLRQARSIVLCGLGASASVALDAQHKLLRFRLPVMAHTDIINQRMVAAGLGPEDCLICISYTGRTRAIVEVAELAQSTGAKTIGITTPGTPLTRHCDLVLGVSSDEDTDNYTPMTSRIAQLVIIDVLATRLALQLGPEFSEHLRKVKMSLADTR